MQVLGYVDKAFSNGLLCSHLEQFHVPSLEVSLDVELRWLKAESPRAVYASVLLVTIFVRPIVKFNKLKMGAFAVGLVKTNSLLVLGLNKELDMPRTLGTFLQLTRYVDHTRDHTPLL